MTKKEFISRLDDLLYDVENSTKTNFDDGEIEDLIIEARIPITRSNGINFTKPAFIR